MRHAGRRCWAEKSFALAGLIDAVHFWNEILRRQGIDKDARHSGSSTFERLKRRHRVGRCWLDRLSLR